MAIAEISGPQRQFASVLSVLSVIAIIALLAAFFVYATGILPSELPPEKVSGLWNLKAGDYLAATGQETGWGWLSNLGEGESLAKAALALLGSCILVCYAFAAVSFIRAKDRIHAVIALAQIVVLVIAATGVGGGH